MPLIISPRTYSLTRDAIVKHFNAEKADADFWHSNFKDFFYKAQLNAQSLFILFVGYGQLAMKSGIESYDRLMRKDDTSPKAYYLGSCFATEKSGLDLCEILVPEKSYSQQDVVTEIALEARKLDRHQNLWNFDERMVEQLTEAAKKLKIKISGGNIFCKETYDPNFWFPFAQNAHKEGYVAGEVESAAFVSACNLIDISSAALLDVKDTMRNGEYIKSDGQQRMEALEKMLLLIDATI